MNVVMYKLLSGEEIVAKEKFVEDQTIVIEDGVVLMYQQMDGGRMSVGFAPFMPYGDGKISLSASAVSAKCAPKDQILQEYNRIFSNIVIAPASVLQT